MKITLPELSLVVLVGPSGCGKSSFAKAHFKGTEVLSSDYCRGLVADDENDQSATNDAFEILHTIAAKRLALGRLTVIDATNVQMEARKPLVELARRFHVLPVAIVLNVDEKICQERNRNRPDRQFGPHVVRNQSQSLRRSLRRMENEGFRHVFILNSPEEIASAEIVRQPLWNNRKDDHGPFDVIGDVHGCFDELCALLTKLGWKVEEFQAQPPAGRKAIFVGDLVDRGPKTPEVLKLVMNMCSSGVALCVPGNHDIKLMKKLRGRDVTISHGLKESLEQLELETPEFREAAAKFLDALVSHYVLDRGELVVAHAGMKEHMQGRGSGRVRDFALYGETTGEVDEYGLPVRLNWAAEYRGKAMVVYGHTPVPEAEWLNRTIDIDTGCVFGGKLTALRYPEREIVSVPAQREYYAPTKPLRPAAEELSAQQSVDELLDIADVMGKRFIRTELSRNITIREENATAALEIMSRFAVNPKWLIYLPPTMSPSETSKREGYLEYPTEAFNYFRNEEVSEVICEQKHMGSRAVVVIARDEETVRKRFGIIGEGIGVCYTRTGRRFFTDPAIETAFLRRLHSALERSGSWDRLNSAWFCLDCELMPWSAKAQELLRHQYAPTGSAATASLPEAVRALEGAALANPGVAELLDRFRRREEMGRLYVDSYRRYCWPVNGIEGLKLAPFHLLASEGGAHYNQSHRWHMDELARICAADPDLLLATPYRVVDVFDEEQVREATEWWEKLTAIGGEGMVVKPLNFMANGKKGLVQPALKCRGREYLRIIYGPEYSAESSLSRLRSRALAAKRSLAMREFCLGVESLQRFVQREPLRRVHECVFGVLALESEPVDPRL